MTVERELEMLLGEVRQCHGPSAADQRRVHQALRERVLQQMAEPNPAQASDRRAHLRLLLGSGGSTMVGMMTLAAAAAAAVVTLARPALERAPRLAGLEGAKSEVKPEPVELAAAKTSKGHDSRLQDSGEALGEPDPAGGCSAWPCLEPEPRRALSLGGAELTSASARRAQSELGIQKDGPGQDRAFAREGAPEASSRATLLELTPALALDVAPGRVTPGAGLRVAAPVTRSRDLALEATLQQFPVDGARGLLAGSMGVCWRPIRGEFDASLCGRMGYETGTIDTSDEARASEWRVTAGASAQAIWNLSEELGAYVAVQGMMPIAAARGAERALGMRVMMGPQVSF